MNYIKEMNAFYDWLEINSISTSAIALWHALMHINNKAGWIPEFTVAISVLEVKSGLKKGAIIRSRLTLQQLGRIDFKSRSGQQSAIYKIIPFYPVDNFEKSVDNFYENPLCSFKERKPVHKPDANQYANRTQSGTQTGSISNNTFSIITTKQKQKETEGEVCEKCHGKGWYIEQETFNNGLSLKDKFITCDCKNQIPAWQKEAQYEK